MNTGLTTLKRLELTSFNGMVVGFSCLQLLEPQEVGKYWPFRRRQCWRWQREGSWRHESQRLVGIDVGHRVSLTLTPKAVGNGPGADGRPIYGEEA
jgi:hypothetical protein